MPRSPSSRSSSRTCSCAGRPAAGSGLCPFHAETQRLVQRATTTSASTTASAATPRATSSRSCRRSSTSTSSARSSGWPARAGIKLRYTTGGEGRDRQRRKVLVDAMEAAVEWYHQRLLTAPDARPARDYLRSRGIDGDVARRFQLGWAPDDWDALASALRRPDDVARETGLAFLNRRDRLQDAFRARVMFPIFNEVGDAVAFGGRVLPGSADPAKYKNSPETRDLRQVQDALRAELGQGRHREGRSGGRV